MNANICFSKMYSQRAVKYTDFFFLIMILIYEFEKYLKAEKTRKL